MTQVSSAFGTATPFPVTEEFVLPILHTALWVTVDMDEDEAMDIIDYICEIANGSYPENPHHGLLTGCGTEWFIDTIYTDDSSRIQISTPLWSQLPHPMFLTQDRCLTPMHAAWISSMCNDNMSIFRAFSILIDSVGNIEPIRPRHANGIIMDAQSHTTYYQFNTVYMFNGAFWRSDEEQFARVLPEEHKSDGQDVHLIDEQPIISILDCPVYQRELNRVRTWLTPEQHERIDENILNNPSVYLTHTQTEVNILRTNNKFITFREMLIAEFGQIWYDEFGSRFAYYFMYG